MFYHVYFREIATADKEHCDVVVEVEVFAGFARGVLLLLLGLLGLLRLRLGFGGDCCGCGC